MFDPCCDRTEVVSQDFPQELTTTFLFPVPERVHAQGRHPQGMWRLGP